MNKMLCILIFSLLLFSCSDSEKVASKTEEKVAPKTEEKVAPKTEEKLAGVQVDGKWGYVNLMGEIVIKTQFEDAKGFSEGLAAVQVGGKWGYVNTEGEIIIKPQFDEAGAFSKEMRYRGGVISGIRDAVEKLASVRVGRKVGYINREGKFFATYRGLSFSEGLAIVRVGNKLGYIKHGGEIVIEPQFD